MVAALATGCTILLTWPFVLRLSTFYKDAGDYPLNGWILWYNQLALTTGRVFHHQAYFNSTQFYSLPYSLAYSEHLFIPSLLFDPLYWLTHHLILSVNLFGLITFSLTFLSSYYTLNYFMKNSLSSILGAMVFTFNPLVFSHFPDHLQLMNRYFIPPLFLLAYLFFKEPRWKSGLLFFLFFTLNALSVIYFQLMCVLLLPLFFLPFLAVHLANRNWKYFIHLFQHSLIGLLFLPLLLYFNLPYLEFSTREQAIRDLDYNRILSARGIDWVSPPADSLVYQRFSKSLYDWKVSGEHLDVDHTLFLNMTPFVLFLLGIVWWISWMKKRKPGDWNVETALFFFSNIGILLGALVFSFGPYFLGWNNDYGTFRLPFYSLYKLTSLLDGFRAPTRFQFIFYIPFSIFVACGAQQLLKNSKVRASLLFSCLFLFVLLENIHPRNYQETASMFESVKAKQTDFHFLKDKFTLHLPSYAGYLLTIHDVRTPSDFTKVAFLKESTYLTWQTLTEERTLNGYSGYVPDDLATFLGSLNEHLDERAINELSLLGINYVVIHKKLFTESPFLKPFRASKTLLDLGRVFEDDETLILDLGKYSTELRRCSLGTDFSIDNPHLYAVDGEPNYCDFVLKNHGDCYLPSQFQHRYLPLQLELGNQVYAAYLKLPLLIKPHQQMDARVFLRPLKVEFAPIDFPAYRLKVRLP